MERSGPIIGIHSAQDAGPLEPGSWVPMQVLTTWTSALCLQNMLEQLLIYQPKDPIPFMINHLQLDNDNVPKIVILGPPASGKTTIAMWLCKHLNSNLLTMENLIAKEFSSLAAEARRHYQTVKTVPSMQLVRLIRDRLSEEDCIRRGWILDGIPESREQALMIQTLGITPRHVIVLSAPDTVLIERNLGKRVDPQTGALTYVQTNRRSNAPFTPRVLLCGPVGSGKSLQAALLAQKYGLVNVCCGHLLKEAVAEKSKFGEMIQPFFEKDTAVPDSIVVKVLSQRLSQQDCLQKGWVLHGFPRDLDQAHLLHSLGCKPNRVFFLNVPFDSVIERLTLRRTDPVTGERYHLMYKPPPTMEIQARLLQSPKDAEEHIKLKMDLFYRNSAELEEFYWQALTLNGDQDPHTVFEYIESGIINPLPRKVP
ncbi:adenylate kinase 8 isoform X4 [Diceros bicornis minor]|uniref:adenylate kinase 8 isoform X4 n=1 Tax=Diceros bicornis minor TaxID=77932 RepID=UPI0026E933E1|nr:adenylate kinase 8 isoform X4 [Diceros bicornis minor]